jgi:tetratricopeptide (TPR) repeat protein
MGFFRAIYQRLRGIGNIPPRANLDHEMLTAATAVSFSQQAHEALVNLDFDAAVAHYTQAINLAPNIGANYFYRGAILSINSLDEAEAAENQQKAEADYQMAVRLDPALMEMNFRNASITMLTMKYVYKPLRDQAQRALDCDQSYEGDEKADE